LHIPPHPYKSVAHNPSLALKHTNTEADSSTDFLKLLCLSFPLALHHKLFPSCCLEYSHFTLCMTPCFLLVYEVLNHYACCIIGNRIEAYVCMYSMYVYMCVWLCVGVLVFVRYVPEKVFFFKGLGSGVCPVWGGAFKVLW